MAAIAPTGRGCYTTGRRLGSNHRELTFIVLSPDQGYLARNMADLIAAESESVQNVGQQTYLCIMKSFPVRPRFRQLR